MTEATSPGAKNFSPSPQGRSVFFGNGAYPSNCKPWNTCTERDLVFVPAMNSGEYFRLKT